ncbi:MAG: M20/M25/M40 family metallo-hydrolase [Candidatus Parvarchaeota archaeon]
MVVEARRAVKEVTGLDSGISGFVASSDMHFLVNEAKIPTIILGPGSLNEAHIIDEYVEEEQVHKPAKIYSMIVMNVLQQK